MLNEIFKRPLKKGDLILLDETGCFSQRNPGYYIVVGENQIYNGYNKGFYKANRNCYLVEHPVEEELNIKNKLLAMYTEYMQCEVNKKIDKKIPTKKINLEYGDIVTDGTLSYLYLGQCYIDPYGVHLSDSLVTSFLQGGHTYVFLKSDIVEKISNGNMTKLNLQTYLGDEIQKLQSHKKAELSWVLFRKEPSKSISKKIGHIETTELPMVGFLKMGLSEGFHYNYKLDKLK